MRRIVMFGGPSLLSSIGRPLTLIQGLGENGKTRSTWTILLLPYSVIADEDV